MMSEIFKAYDIRGIFPTELNEDTVYKIGRAYADMIGKGKKLVVGRDMRLSSPELKDAIIKGITDQGVNVIDIDLASTPTFYFAVSKLEADGGMQISASHNPKEYNGVKIVGPKSYPVSFDTGISKIKDKVMNNDFEEVGQKGTIEIHEGILEEELEFSLTKQDTGKIKDFKIVADAANAMGAPYLEALFGRLPCELIKMNFELDGTFPAHQADPYQDKNIADLRKRVLDENADLGIATDGDGDRIFFIDNKGELVEPAIIRGILAKVYLKENPGATICYDIRPGKITYDMIVENGGKPSMTKVGHSLIKAQGIEEGAVFAGESSGHFFIKSEHGFYEMPMIVTLKMLAELTESKKSFADYVAPLKRYSHSGEINSEVEDKEGKMNELAEKYNDAKISRLDGVTIEYDDFWFNVRPSNTEPKLRLNLEAVNEEVMKQKRDEVLAIIRG
ncbi:phosphomannomutase/phosphoglucomutase [Candidatus Woesearchaeota archaeon]|nr:phosphomannomutase/phosphoglucomutase [Candidatus Woesearchaeota archaeon]